MQLSLGVASNSFGAGVPQLEKNCGGSMYTVRTISQHVNL